MVTYKVKDLNEFIKLAEETSNNLNKILFYLDEMGVLIADIASFNLNQNLGATQIIDNLSTTLYSLREEIESGQSISILDLINNIDDQLDQLEQFSNSSISEYLQKLTLIFANTVKPELEKFFTNSSDTSETLDTSNFIPFVDSHGNTWYYNYELDNEGNKIFILDKNNPELNKKLFEFYKKYLPHDIYSGFISEEHVQSFIRNIINMFNVDRLQYQKSVNEALLKIENAIKYRIYDFKNIDKKSKEETEKLIINFLNKYIESPEIVEGIDSEKLNVIKNEIPNFAKQLIDKYY